MRSSFFPNIYNEDWFFLLDDARLRPTAIAGRMVQQPFDPFANDKRARAEELGDCLAEGVFWLLDHGRTVEHATLGYWQRFLHKRFRFITEIIERLEQLQLAPAERDRVIAALKAARGRSRLITPQLCVYYLAAWRADRVRWRRHVADLSGRLATGHLVPCWPGRERLLDPEKLLAQLGLADRAVTCGLGAEAEPAA